MCQAKPHSQNWLCHFGVRESCSRFNGVSVGSCVERGTRSSAHHPVKSGGKTAALQNFQGERLANGSEAKKKPLTEGARGKRVISGMRPTGRLHIGHYFGALQNWVRLQNDLSYDCFYFIADWHALTSDYADTSAIAQNVIEIATDYLAVGLDPKKSVIFQQSQIPEHAELHLLLSMVTPLGWLERVPTYKEALENVKDRDLHTYGFLGYPILQCADIVIYSKEGIALFVPVGEDQVSHLETSREIVHRFNTFYGLEIDEMLRDESRAWVLGEMQAPLRIAPLHPGTHKFRLDDTAWAETKAKIRTRILEIGFNNAIAALKEIQSGAEYV